MAFLVCGRSKILKGIKSKAERVSWTSSRQNESGGAGPRRASLEEPRLLPYSMCEVTEWKGGASRWPCGGSPSRASGLRFQAAVKVEVRADDGGRVHELGLIIKQTTNL